MMANIEVTKDEQDQQQFDATAVTGLDPSKHYRWVRKDPVNLTRKQIAGYTVTARTPEMIHVVATNTVLKKGEDLSTAIEWGDMILMETSLENFKARQGRKRAKTLRQTQGVAQAYKEAIARMSRSAGQRNLGFEEHQDTSGAYRESVSEAELVSEMSNSPEVEGPRIGRI